VAIAFAKNGSPVGLPDAPPGFKWSTELDQTNVYFVLNAHPVTVGWFLKLTYDYSAEGGREVWRYASNSKEWKPCEPEEFEGIVAARIAKYRLGVER